MCRCFGEASDGHTLVCRDEMAETGCGARAKEVMSDVSCAFAERRTRQRCLLTPSGARLRRPRKHRIHPVWWLHDAATSADHERHAVKRLGVVRQPRRAGVLCHGMGERLVRDLADLRP